MEFVRTLTQIGLPENQARVYVSCLQIGEGSVLRIAKEAQLKRPTVYLLLDELEKSGLVIKVQKGNKSVYRPMDPEKIIIDLQQKVQIARDLLPSLKTIDNRDLGKPTIRITETISGVQEIYKNIFLHMKHHPEEKLRIYGSLKDAVENFKDTVIDFFYEIMRESQHQIREIGNDDAETRLYYRKSHRINPNHEIRFIRPGINGRFFQTDNMLYGNSLVIFSVKKEIFAITIESAGVAETYRTLFDMAWQSGIPA